MARVKRWFLSTGDIEWQSFSSNLAEAPLSERVGVCVLSRRDGSGFDLPPGEDTSTSVESIVVIARPNGRGTIFMMGSLEDNLFDTPTSF